jgi:hypothetical protein
LAIEFSLGFGATGIEAILRTVDDSAFDASPFSRGPRRFALNSTGCNERESVEATSAHPVFKISSQGCGGHETR